MNKHTHRQPLLGAGTPYNYSQLGHQMGTTYIDEIKTSKLVIYMRFQIFEIWKNKIRHDQKVAPRYDMFK
jgi:hypothetical protein